MRSCSFRVSSRWQSASLSEETRKTSQSGAKVLETGGVTHPRPSRPSPPGTPHTAWLALAQASNVCRALLSMNTYEFI